MESRSYTGGKGRTKMKTLHLGRIDLAAGFIIFLFSALIIYTLTSFQPQL